MMEITSRISVRFAAAIGLLLLTGSPANALCIGACRSDDIQSIYGGNSDVHLTRWIKDSKREATDEFPAVGRILCSGDKLGSMDVVGSAVVVGRRDVIATAGHVLFDEDNGCKPRTGCEFVTTEMGVEIRRKIGPSQKKVSYCPITYDEEWVVSMLSSPVPFEPLQLGATYGNEPTIAVNGINMDFLLRKDMKHERGFPTVGEGGYAIQLKSKAPCANLGFGARQFIDLIMTNCSGSNLSAGSALLNPNNQIAGILIQTTSESELIKKFNAGNYDVTPCDFNPETCATYYRAINGAFLAEIKRVVDLSKIAAGSGDVGLVSDDLVAKARELLTLAMKCPGKTKEDFSPDKNPTLQRYDHEYRGTADVFQAVETMSEMQGNIHPVYPAGGGATKIGHERIHREEVFANFSTMGEDDIAITVEGLDENVLTLSCEYCAATREVADEEVLNFSDGSREVEKNKLEVRGAAKFSIHNLCRDQVENATLALKILIRAARAKLEASPPGADEYRIAGLAPYDFLAIRKGPGKKHDMIGMIPTNSGRVKLRECRNVSGYKSQWCKTNWGSIEGWVSMSKLVPAVQ